MNEVAAQGMDTASVIDKISAFFEDFEFSNLLPDLGQMQLDIVLLCRIALMVGPIVLIVLGLSYFFLAPKEANWYFGYRTYFGMGSIAAWRFTQKLAGVVLGILGVVLTVAMALFAFSMNEADAMASVWTGVYCLAAQAVLALIANLAIMITVYLRFDAKGHLRRKKKK